MKLLSLYGITIDDQDYIHLSGFTGNVKRVAKMLTFFDEYVSKLGTIEQQIQQEKAQFESEKLDFQVP